MLVSANTERSNLLPLPLGLISVCLATQRAGHEVKLVDLMAEDDGRSAVREAIVSFKPEIIGISVRNIDDQNMEKPRFFLDEVRKLISCCRELSDRPIVLGGAGYSIFPESALNYLEADLGIQGEGEEAFPLLLDCLGQGKDLSGVPGLYLRGAGRQGERIFMKDLAGVPRSDTTPACWHIDDREECWLPLQTRRGCPMDCSYCSTATIEGRVMRMRPPEAVRDEIAGHVAAGCRSYYFVDNIFNIPADYAKTICREIMSVGREIAWRCIIYPQRVDEELVQLMAKAGCREISLGFESGCDRILRQMNKRYSSAEVRQLAAMFHDYGIRQTGFLLLGGPGETRESIQESLLFAEALPLESLKVTVGIRIYPGTTLARTARAEGMITAADDLLFPRFYVVPTLRDWLYETINQLRRERPHWLV